MFWKNWMDITHKLIKGDLEHQLAVFTKLKIVQINIIIISQILITLVIHNIIIFTIKKF